MTERDIYHARNKYRSIGRRQASIPVFQSLRHRKKGLMTALFIKKSLCHKTRIRVKINLNSYHIYILFKRFQYIPNHDHKEETASAIVSKIFLSLLRVTSALSLSESCINSFWELVALFILRLFFA